MPRCPAGRRPPATKAGTRHPPSQLLPLPPRSGALLPPTCTGEPLSVDHTKSVVSHIPVALSASVTFLAVSSTVETIALNTRCVRQSNPLYLHGPWDKAPKERTPTFGTVEEEQGGAQRGSHCLLWGFTRCQCDRCRGGVVFFLFFLVAGDGVCTGSAEHIDAKQQQLQGQHTPRTCAAVGDALGLDPDWGLDRRVGVVHRKVPEDGKWP